MTSLLLKQFLWLSFCFVQFSEAVVSLNNHVRTSYLFFQCRHRDNATESYSCFLSSHALQGCVVLLQTVKAVWKPSGRWDQAHVLDPQSGDYSEKSGSIFYPLICLDKGPEGPWVFGPINMRLLFVWIVFFPVLIQLALHIPFKCF